MRRGRSGGHDRIAYRAVAVAEALHGANDAPFQFMLQPVLMESLGHANGQGVVFLADDTRVAQPRRVIFGGQHQL